MNSSFPYGEDACIIEEGFVADGTAHDGEAVLIDQTDPEKVTLCGDNGLFYGILVYDAKNGVAKATAPAAGTKVRVCVHGPCVARIVCAADNQLGGSNYYCGANGVLTVAADGKNTVAFLLDKRAKNGTTNDTDNEHIVYVTGAIRNDT
jgi:antitoxin (DNA-binding transcriptional repressor) of toxin-antitoxin stability system